MFLHYNFFAAISPQAIMIWYYLDKYNAIWIFETVNLNSFYTD